MHAVAENPPAATEGCSTPVEHQLPKYFLENILLEVVLQEGDKALQTLALVCSMFYNLVNSERFRRKAHFLWLDSVVTWRRFSSTYQQDFRRMYVLETCRQCKEVYKNCIPGIGKIPITSLVTPAVIGYTTWMCMLV
ncbi:hypothetical protein SKAU_G00061080 [Synaphobranchus kaupii]|uniref:F-box domain-containing protein n=1 Tax=Synaphobranchus kaupii TaxID=118154 RepID=A0A9Q1JAD1_SYNKA|nr:hypothetical protein SKAU_G00061080 [Synaphobranchus kaupii]